MEYFKTAMGKMEEKFHQFATGLPTRFVIYRAVKDGSVQPPGLGIASRLDESGLGGNIMKALRTRDKKTVPPQPEPDTVDTAPAEQPTDEETGRAEEPGDARKQQAAPASSTSEQTEMKSEQTETAPGEDAEDQQPDDNFFNGMRPG